MRVKTQESFETKIKGSKLLKSTVELVIILQNPTELWL